MDYIVFKKIYLKYTLRIFIYFGLANICAMEIDEYALYLPDTIDKHNALDVLNNLKNPIPKTEKFNLLKNWETKNPLLDKGFFQAYVQIKNHPKNDQYLYYKLSKYALAVFIEILKLQDSSENYIICFDPTTKKIAYNIINATEPYAHGPENYYFINNFTYKSWQNIYTQIKDPNILKSTLEITELSFQLAFLLDIQNKSDINCGINITWPDIQNLYNQPYHNSSLLKRITDNKNKEIDYEKIKSWCNKKNNYFLLIFNTNPEKEALPTGLNTIISTITRKFCMLHFPIKHPTEAHNREFLSGTGYIVHDLDHFYITIQDRLGKSAPTAGEKKFLYISKKILRLLVQSYQSTSDATEKKDILRSIFLLFFILHETVPHHGAYDNRKSRITFKKTLDYYFFNEPLGYTILNLDLKIPEKERANILFNLTDMKKFYESIDPEVEITHYPAVFDEHQIPSYKEIYKVTAQIEFLLLKDFHKFYFKYGQHYIGTLPFLLGTPNEIKRLKELADY